MWRAMGTNFPTIVLTAFMSLMYFVMYSIITLNMTVGSYSGYCLASCSGKGKKNIVMRRNFHTTAKWVHYSKLYWWRIQNEIDGFIKPGLNFSHKQNFANTEPAKCNNNYISVTKEVIRMAAAASHSSLSRIPFDLRYNRRGRQTDRRWYSCRLRSGTDTVGYLKWTREGLPLYHVDT